ncbi:MAG: ATP-binding protein [Candidatus Aenigmatarchaeota archaeon]
MVLGKLSDKITTKSFSFDAEARVKRLEYITLKDTEGRWILAYADSIMHYKGKTKVHANVIGYRDKRGFLKTPNVPFSPESPVFAAEEDFIRETLSLEDEGMYLGLLDGYDIKVHLPVKHLIKKHFAVLAKTGSGKSYATGVLLEELVEEGVPVVVLDPHGEYYSLAKSNENKTELKSIERFDVKPKSYKQHLSMFGVNTWKPIKLNSRLSPQEIFQILPTKISSSQKGLLYSAIRNLEGAEYSIRDIIDEVNQSKSQSKWNLISMLEFLDSTKLFSANPTTPHDLVKEGKITILDLKDAKPELQQIIALKVVEDLFNARKKGKIPEFLLVVEEAHNFCPERGFGEVASSKILRTVASEGRKFGMGLAIVSQRPARVDKNVLSQANTQIILKVTNPNDLRAITESVEGVTPETKNEIKDLPVGVAMVVGVTEQPLIVDVRVRRTEHGGSGIVPVESLTRDDGMLLFEPKVTEKNIKQEFKGIDDIRFLNYPIWRIETDSRTLKEIYIDGITGEILFKQKDFIMRSKGVKEVLDLPASSRVIVLYLMLHKYSTVEKLAEDLKMPLTTVKTNIKNLLTADYVATDGYMFRNKESLNLPTDPDMIQLNEEVAKGLTDGHMLDFLVSTEFAKRAAEIWSLRVKRIDPIYYPYWVVKHKSKRFLVDGISSRIDSDMSEIVMKLL